MSTKFIFKITIVIGLFLVGCTTVEWRMVRTECAQDALQQYPVKEEINIQTLYKTVEVPTGRMNCSGTTRQRGYFGGDPVCTMEMRSESQPYQNVRKVDANAGIRRQVIDSCTQSLCTTRYGNARCEPKKVETSGKFGGLGIGISMRNGVLTVISLIEGTPAFNAGIQTGDKIIKIEGNSTLDMTLTDAVSQMRGEIGTAANITIFREGLEKLLDLQIVRAIIKAQNIKR
tara:strand:- start:171 stop:860 length:690 start_codon:yes stop_codon:yes gene_type:complete